MGLKTPCEAHWVKGKLCGLVEAGRFCLVLYDIYIYIYIYVLIYEIEVVWLFLIGSLFGFWNLLQIVFVLKMPALVGFLLGLASYGLVSC